MPEHEKSRQPAACLIQTGQTSCHDEAGREIGCRGSGQDAEYRIGITWPEPRFEPVDDTVLDRLTGLYWSRDANPAEFPLTWLEALDYVEDMSRRGVSGHRDWRLPNRRELRSLVSHQASRPALPEGQPFLNLFPGWYWTSTSAAISPTHAWYVHMQGARMFYGGKDQSFLLWPVRGAGNGVLPATGQTRCYGADGKELACTGSGQDGALRSGRAWPRPRFRAQQDGVRDELTGLVWHADTDLLQGSGSWIEALRAVSRLNPRGSKQRPWRLPNINELESLVDCSRCCPALPVDAGFANVCDTYWSSTTSRYEPDWAWALYLDKGAVGVGQKRGKYFHVWAVK